MDLSNDNFNPVQDIETKICESLIECDSFILSNSGINDVKIFHMNVRSILKNFDTLLAYLSTFSFNFDILILSEAWLREVDLNQFTFNDYNVFGTKNNFNQNSGLVFLSSSRIQTLSVTELLFSGATALQVVFTCGSGDEFCLLCIYRSPNENVDTFLTELRDNLSRIIVKNYKTVFLMGDVNIDIMNYSVICNEYLSLLYEYVFMPYINTFTRVSPNGIGSCLDHVFIRNKNNTVSFLPIVLQSHITDHFSTLLVIKNNCKIDNICSSSNDSINFVKLRKLFELESWSLVLNDNDVEKATSVFMDRINNFIVAATETKIFHKKPKFKKLKPWITHGLVVSIRKKEKLLCKFKKNPNNEKLKKYIKKYQSILKYLIKLKKKEYYSKLVVEAGSDSKRIWNLVNDFTGKKIKRDDIDYLKIDNNTVRVMDNLVLCANTFNDFFCNIGKELAEKIQTPSVRQPVSQQPVSNMNSFYIVTHEYVENLIDSLNVNRSAGVDRISARIIKSNKVFFVKPLTHIFNLSLTTGIFPKHFKNALVRPIFKKGDKTLVDNYRPISLISNFAKLLEKIIKAQLSDFLTRNNIISPNQFGFQKAVGTQDAIVKLTSEVCMALDQSKKVLAIFLDLAKAFDTVCPTLLLEKLESRIGITGVALQWFRSYLSNRQQSVGLYGSVSNTRLIQYGVPQGTVLGPILFVLYINDLLSIQMDSCQILSFADDTVLLLKGEDWDGVSLLAERSLVRTKEWLDQNRLTLNVNKTCFIPFTIYKTSDIQISIKLHSAYCGEGQCNQSVDCVSLNRVECTSYLGVIIDQHLRWDVHIKSMVKRLNKFSYLFATLRPFLPVSVLKIVYFSFVQSVIQYGIVAWGGAYNIFMNDLQIVQNKLIKIILNKGRFHSTDDLYRTFKVLNVRQLFVKNCLLKLIKDNRLNFLVTRTTRRTARGLLFEPSCRTTLGQRQYLFLAPRFFNILPDEVRVKYKNKNYKFIIKTFLLNDGLVDSEGFF